MIIISVEPYYQDFVKLLIGLTETDKTTDVCFLGKKCCLEKIAESRPFLFCRIFGLYTDSLYGIPSFILGWV